MGRGRGSRTKRGSSSAHRGNNPRGRRGKNPLSCRGNNPRGWGGITGPVLPEVSSKAETEVQSYEDIEISDVRGLFINSTSFDKHFASQEQDRDFYMACMLCLHKYRLEMSQGSRARALAAAISRRDHELMDVMLSKKELFGMVEVVKALNMLDAKRQVRVAEKTLAKLKKLDKVKKAKLSKMKYTIDNLTTNTVSKGTMSGAVARHIRRWVKTIPAVELEFYALHYPKDAWKKVADLIHLNPKKDFQLDWFLRYCYGEEAPENSMVSKCKSLDATNINAIIRELDIPYSHIKELKNALDNESKKRIAEYETLATLIWWYEDLVCDPFNKVLEERLEKGETIDLSYGKLMERLFKLREIAGTSKLLTAKLMQVAEDELKNIQLPLESPVAVLGDRSASMQVCVKVSNIIASLLSFICDAKINFFNTGVSYPPFQPTSVESVLRLGNEIKATGSTAPAASLWPFFEKKEEVKTFIIVTDEEENTQYNQFHFKQLFDKYSNEVHKAELVFVSFLRNQHGKGHMLSKFPAEEQQRIKQFRFDQGRPDLTKLDHMFGVLSTESAWFEQHVRLVKQNIQDEGLVTAAANWKLN